MKPVVYLIIIVVFLVANAAKKEKQAEKRRQAMNKQQAAPQVQKRPAQQARAVKKPLTQDEIRKAAESLLSQKVPAPAQPLVQTKPAPVGAGDEGFYQGTSFGDEGVDPCHDDLYHDDLYEEKRNADAQEHQAPAPAPAIQLQFTPSTVLNGVIMSEVLNHHV